MDNVYASVKSGGSIAAPIRGDDMFPAMVSHMVSVGEETGQLEHMLNKIADFYEAEVDAKVKALTSLLEPIMICVVGGIVGFIVISMYLPIFSCTTRFASLTRGSRYRGSIEPSGCRSALYVSWARVCSSASSSRGSLAAEGDPADLAQDLHRRRGFGVEDRGREDDPAGVVRL